VCCSLFSFLEKFNSYIRWICRPRKVRGKHVRLGFAHLLFIRSAGLPDHKRAWLRHVPPAVSNCCRGNRTAGCPTPHRFHLSILLAEQTTERGPTDIRKPKTELAVPDSRRPWLHASNVFVLPVFPCWHHKSPAPASRSPISRNMVDIRPGRHVYNGSKAELGHGVSSQRRFFH